MRMKSIFLPVTCDDEECGLYSVYECFEDGSHIVITRACWHTKKLPSRKTILESMKSYAHEESKTRN